MNTTTLAMKYATYVRSDNPGACMFNKTGYLYLHGSNPTAQAWVYFALPFPSQGANVAKATLRLRTRKLGTAGEQHAIGVQTCAEPLHFGTMTWNNRPTKVDGSAVWLTKNTPIPNNGVWELDVTAMVQRIADGGPYGGFRLMSTDAAGNSPLFVQVNQGAATDPQLIIQWSESPLAPDSLAPSSGRVVGTQTPTLRFDFTDHVGDTALAAVQVQTASSATGFDKPTWDSGSVASTTASLDLSTQTSYPKQAAGTVVWWRVRAQDGSGLWSAWSLPTSFTYQPLPSASWVNPSPTTPTVTDTTPPFDWNYSGASPQARFKVYLYQADANGRWVLVQASPDTMSSDTDWTPTIPLKVAGRYRVLIHASDKYDREAVPGFPTWAQASQEFTFSPSTKVTAPTNLTASSVLSDPIVRLFWNCAEEPDYWTVYRDGNYLARYPGADLHRGGNTYSIPDSTTPNGPHTWEVYAVKNGVTSKPATLDFTEDHWGTWLVEDVSGGAQVCIQNDTTHDMTMPEVGTVHEVLGGSRVVVITEALRGYEGTIDGGIYALPGNNTDPATWRDNLLDFKSTPGRHLRLLVEDMSFPVVIRNTLVKGDPNHRGEWLASFEFYQTGDYTFTADLDGDEL